MDQNLPTIPAHGHSSKCRLIHIRDQVLVTSAGKKKLVKGSSLTLDGNAILAGEGLPEKVTTEQSSE